jgi:hypothetical protein
MIITKLSDNGPRIALSIAEMELHEYEIRVEVVLWRTGPLGRALLQGRLSQDNPTKESSSSRTRIDIPRPISPNAGVASAFLSPLQEGLPDEFLFEVENGVAIAAVSFNAGNNIIINRAGYSYTDSSGLAFRKAAGLLSAALWVNDPDLVSMSWVSDALERLR